MVRRDGAEARKERIQLIGRIVHAALNKAKEAGLDWIVLSKMIAEIMIETGLTKNKVMEYLLLRSETGEFELDEKDDKIRRSDV